MVDRPYTTSVLVAAALCGCAPDAEPPPAATLAIESATLVDGHTGATRPETTILIADGRIAAVGPAGEVSVPEGARTIDGAGKWVIPGIVDVHTHIRPDDTAGLRRFLAAGVTTIHSMPSGDPLTDPTSWERHSRDAATAGPRVQATPLFSAEFPDNLFPGAYPLTKPTDAAAARAAVRAAHDLGYRQIKIIQEDGTPFVGVEGAVADFDDDVFLALVDEARALGMRVYVHATRLEDARLTLRAGAHAFMHGIMDRSVPDSVWSRMVERGIVWTPAFRMLSGYGDSRDFNRRAAADSALHPVLGREGLEAALAAARPDAVPAPGLDVLYANVERYLDTLAANTRAALAAGVPIAVGSDGGPPGVGTHVELELMQERGVEPAQVIIAATSAGARALGLSEEIGALEKGMVADLVVLGADPTKDVRNARQVEWVVKAGNLWSTSELLALP